MSPADFDNGEFQYALPAQYFPPDYARHEIEGDDADKQLFLNNWKIETKYEFILDGITNREGIRLGDERGEVNVT